MKIGKNVVISLDTELAWGFIDFEKIPRKRVRNARASWEYLLEIFDEYEFPVTWAIVGHLFNHSCDGIHDRHSSTDHWFNHDPGTDYTEDPLYYAPDLIEKTIYSDTNHEIASHSYSHMIFTEEYMDIDKVLDEVQNPIGVENKSVNYKSFVYPRNEVAYRETLSENGYICYRGNNESRWENNLSGRVSKITDLTFANSSPEITMPTIDEFGLVNIPASMSLFIYRNKFRSILQIGAKDPIVEQVRLGLNELIKRDDGVLHLWLHPNDIQTRSDRIRMKRVCELIGRHRDRNRINVRTMGEIANLVKDGE